MKDNHVQHHGAHSGSHGGISDYNDGCNVWHYGGNNESANFDDRPAFISGNEDVYDLGNTANGNDLTENEDYEEDDWELMEFRFEQPHRPLHTGL